MRKKLLQLSEELEVLMQGLDSEHDSKWKDEPRLILELCVGSLYALFRAEELAFKPPGDDEVALRALWKSAFDVCGDMGWTLQH